MDHEDTMAQSFIQEFCLSNLRSKRVCDPRSSYIILCLSVFGVNFLNLSGGMEH